MRITASGLFATGMVAFMLGFVALMFVGSESDAPLHATMAMAVVGLTSGVAYLGARILFKRAGTSEIEVAPSIRSFVWGAALTVSVAGAVVFLIFSQNSALAELVQNLMEPDRTSTLTELEVRLSAAFMPMWAQVLFEVARRLALPICLIEFLVGGFPDRWRWRAGTAVLVLAAIFVLGTLDRTIPLMYIGMTYLARFSKRGGNPFLDRWFYVAPMLVVVVLVGFKLVQYGDVRAIDTSPNATIQQFTGADGPTESGLPGYGIEPGPLGYGIYVVRSTIERIALSPVAMTLYAFESYNESNFQHWSSTRILSLLGIGRYVSPLEEGAATKYHDAFPVTFLGDLWRQGGFEYMPYFGVFLGLVLFAIDHLMFRRRGYQVWQPLALMGVAFLFYGNALNATAAMLIVGSLCGHLFTSVMSLLLPAVPPQVQPDAKH